MKIIITLLTSFVITLTTISQETSFDYLNPELQKELKLIEQFNPQQNKNYNKSPDAATIMLDSVVSWSFDTTINYWYQSSQVRLEFYPNGSLKSSKIFGVAFIHEYYYDVNNNLNRIVCYEYKNVSWMKQFKVEMLYDANNNMQSRIVYIVENNSWENYQKEVYSYDSNGNRVLGINTYWNGSIWENNTKSEITYLNGKVTLSTNYKWSLQSWEYFNKSEYTYDTNGNTTLVTSYEGNGNTWLLKYKVERSYTSFNEISQFISFNWDGAQWVNGYSKIDYAYNSNNLAIEVIQYNGNGASWDPVTRIMYDYDNNGNQTMKFEQYSNGSSWVNSFKFLTSYNSNSQALVYTNLLWNLSDSTWENATKSDNVYDANGNIIQRIFSSGDSTGWVPTEKREFVFNSAVSADDILHGNQYFFEEHLYNQLTFEKNFVYSNSQWEIRDSATYYYSDIINGIETVNRFNIVVYPNPTTDLLNIQGDFTNPTIITVFDNTGRVVKETRFQGANTQLDLGDLKTGVYFIQLNSRNKQITKKIIKQ